MTKIIRHATLSCYGIFPKKLIFFGFLLVDFFASMETAALTVAAPKIGAFFELSGKMC
ncbi:MAG: hypothetical protein PHF35_05115 [Candidatus Moranbacteria bacterium]|nr:hypothetical protein [Candidatus Moranbacteria bacterium]